MLCAVIGAAFLLVCIWEFAAWPRRLSPVDPPPTLVARGSTGVRAINV
jgi:hypothetical protein